MVRVTGHGPLRDPVCLATQCFAFGTRLPKKQIPELFFFTADAFLRFKSCCIIKSKRTPGGGSFAFGAGNRT